MCLRTNNLKFAYQILLPYIYFGLIGLIFSESLSNVLKLPKIDENDLETSTKLVRPGGLYHFKEM